MATDSIDTTSTIRDPEPELELAFLPVHKRAFGTATGVASGLLVFAMTIIHLIRADQVYPLSLLGQYFYGYTVSLQGAVIGMFWAGIAGFVAGWFFAFCRNLALAISTFLVRTRAELSGARDFLDHI
jgi:hypothetical protein